MIVYLHNKCSTCQKALEFLKSKKVPFTVKDITKEAPTIDELQRMLDFQKGNIAKLLNTSGLLYREMELSKKIKTMTLPEILTLLNSNGMLVKRPFLLDKDIGLTGFKEVDWQRI